MSNATPRTTQTDAPARVSKLATLIALLQAPGGASMSTMTAATGWQSHSVRGAMAGAVRRKGHAISSDKTGDTRRWRVAGEAAE